MGACLSTPAHLLQVVDGNEETYQQRYRQDDKVLGQGEFGQVKLVYDLQATDHAAASVLPMACKILDKAAVFRDNILCPPMDPKALQNEIQCLRILQGQEYCLTMHAVYETPKQVYIVTEACLGGELLTYLAAQATDLETADVSRMAFQLFAAVHHMAQHNIIHRDIRPENCMFVSPEPGAALRVIDFGSACIDDDNTKGHAEGHHRTFAGSAFYGSPEMFAKAYNAKTDVWSVGVCLYVILAGYPATQLQPAFQLLHKANRNLRDLPGMPTDVPDTMVDLLHQALTYRYKQRPTAETLLHHDFVVFHQTVQSTTTTTANDTVVASNTSTPTRPSLRVEPSIRLTGNRSRHNQQLGFQTYERSLTTLLATMLSKTDLAQLLVILSNEDNADPTLSSSKTGAKPEQTLDTTQEKLLVVPVRQLQDVIRKEFPRHGKDIVAAMQALPSAAKYQDFPYPIDLLREFTSTTTALPRNGTVAAKAPARPGIKSSFSMRPSRVAMK